MRSREKFSRRVKTVCLVVIVALFTYVFGFSQGQASVYKKAQNDEQFYKQVWGGK